MFRDKDLSLFPEWMCVTRMYSGDGNWPKHLNRRVNGPEFVPHEVRPYCGANWTVVGIAR